LLERGAIPKSGTRYRGMSGSSPISVRAARCGGATRGGVGVLIGFPSTNNAASRGIGSPRNIAHQVLRFISSLLDCPNRVNPELRPSATPTAGKLRARRREGQSGLTLKPAGGFPGVERLCGTGEAGPLEVKRSEVMAWIETFTVGRPILFAAVVA